MLICYVFIKLYKMHVILMYISYELICKILAKIKILYFNYLFSYYLLVNSCFKEECEQVCYSIS